MWVRAQQRSSWISGLLTVAGILTEGQTKFVIKASLAEEKARAISELATAIADKYQKRLYESALSASQKSGD